VGLDVTANCNLVDLELLLQCKDWFEFGVSRMGWS